MKISVPIKTNQNLKYVMEEGDAELVEKIVAKGDNLMFRMFELCQFLDMDHLRRRLACGVAIKLMQLSL